MSAEEKIAEVTSHAEQVFARMKERQRAEIPKARRRYQRLLQCVVTRQAWASGIEASLPKGDRD